MPRLRTLLLVILLLATAACDGAEEPEDTPSPASPTTPATASPTAPASPQSPQPTAPGTPGTPPPASCPQVSGGGQTSLKLVDVRVGTHPGYDRITFEFAPPQPPSPANTLPQYSITKEDVITQDGSGNPIQVDGAALYSLVLQGASGVDLSGGQPVPTYNGPREFKPDFPSLAELEHAGDFEDVLSWGIGLKAERCIKATQLNNPLRLVLDFPHS